jgi:DNA/RNA endonuclease G (NUC1)
MGNYIFLYSILVTEYQQLHLPWGVPSGGEGSSSCLLTQQDYITLYSNALHIPLWTAFKLTRTVRTP